MTPLDVFADIGCPFTHVGLHRLFAARAARGSDRPIVVHAWPLELVNDRPLDAVHVAAEVEALRRDVAPDLFRGFDPAVFPRSSIPAFGLVHAAYALGNDVGERMSVKVRDALFEDGRAVDDPAVLEELASAEGIVLPDGATADAWARRDWDGGRERGVRGSPHFFNDASDWFCPTLVIVRDDGGGYHANVATDRLEEFLASVF